MRGEVLAREEFIGRYGPGAAQEWLSCRFLAAGITKDESNHQLQVLMVRDLANQCLDPAERDSLLQWYISLKDRGVDKRRFWARLDAPDILAAANAAAGKPPAETRSARCYPLTSELLPLQRPSGGFVNRFNIARTNCEEIDQAFDEIYVDPAGYEDRLEAATVARQETGREIAIAADTTLTANSDDGHGHCQGDTLVEIGHSGDCQGEQVNDSPLRPPVGWNARFDANARPDSIASVTTIATTTTPAVNLIEPASEKRGWCGLEIDEPLYQAEESTMPTKRCKTNNEQPECKLQQPRQQGRSMQTITCDAVSLPRYDLRQARPVWSDKNCSPEL